MSMPTENFASPDESFPKEPVKAGFQLCFVCQGRKYFTATNSNIEKAQSFQCESCNLTGLIPINRKVCFKCQGKMHMVGSHRHECSICQGLAHTSLNVFACPRCCGKGHFRCGVADVDCEECMKSGYVKDNNCVNSKKKTGKFAKILGFDNQDPIF